MTAEVIVCRRLPGFHAWPEAPTAVSFLRARHRHLFTIKVKWVVGESRGVEFFLAQAEIEQALTIYPQGLHGYEFGSQGCEDIAAKLLELLPGAVAVEVWEDDENGAECRR